MINELEAEYFVSNNADIDLCCAVKSKVFVQGKGFFSRLIVEIRKKLNNHDKNIELVFNYLDELMEKQENTEPRKKIGYK